MRRNDWHDLISKERWKLLSDRIWRTCIGNRVLVGRVLVRPVLGTVNSHHDERRNLVLIDQSRDCLVDLQFVLSFESRTFVKQSLAVEQIQRRVLARSIRGIA